MYASTVSCGSWLVVSLAVNYFPREGDGVMNAPKSAPTQFAKVSPAGSLSLPADVRRAVGLENGGTVVVETHDGEIRLRTVDEVFAKAREAAREIMGDSASVDDF